MAKARSPYLATLQGTLKKTFTFRKQPLNPNIILSGRPVPTGYGTLKQFKVRQAWQRLAELWKNPLFNNGNAYWDLADKWGVSNWNAFLRFHMPMMKYNPTIYVPFAEGEGTDVQDFALLRTTGNLSDCEWATYNGIPCINATGENPIAYFNPSIGPDYSPPFTYFSIFRENERTTDYPSLFFADTFPGLSAYIDIYLFDDHSCFYAQSDENNNAGCDSLPLSSDCDFNIQACEMFTDHALWVLGGNYCNYEDGTVSSIVTSNAYSMMNYLSLENPFHGKMMLSAIIPGALTIAQVAGLADHYTRIYNTLK